MMNTRFKEQDPQKIKEMTRLYSQIFAVLMNTGKPLIQTIIWLNDNFEDVYKTSETDVRVYEYIFDELGVNYSDKDK